jgi:hypothetical protein
MSDEPTNVRGTLAKKKSHHYPDGSLLLISESAAMLLVERHALYARAEGTPAPVQARTSEAAK